MTELGNIIEPLGRKPGSYILQFRRMFRHVNLLGSGLVVVFRVVAATGEGAPEPDSEVSYWLDVRRKASPTPIVKLIRKLRSLGLFKALTDEGRRKKHQGLVHCSIEPCKTRGGRDLLIYRWSAEKEA